MGINMKRLAILLGLAFLAVLVVGAAGQGTQGIRVFGQGTATVPADTVVISVAVQSNNTSASQAAAENALLLNKTTDALTGAGVQKDEIMPGQSSGISNTHFESNICRQVNNTTVCENTSKALSLLTSSIVIRLKTSDQEKVNGVLKTAKSQGATASVMGYSISDKSQAVAEARKNAIDNARSNAEDVASAAGVKLGKAIDISDYGPSMSFSEPSESSVTPTGTVSVTSIVAVTYEIQ